MADPGFQYTIWAARFPLLAAQVPSQAFVDSLYAEALLIPEGGRIVNDCTLAAGSAIVMMNLLVAHLAFLSLRDASVVGQMQTAGQGSVTLALQYPTSGTTEAWFGQSQYGAELWRIMGSYRGFQYAPGPGVCRPGLGISFAPNVYAGNGGNPWPWR